MASVIRLHNSLLKRSLPLINQRLLISTSKKNKDSAAAEATSTKSVASPIMNEKNWVSYGFDFKTKEDDSRSLHAVFFGTITLCIVFGGLAFMYVPDYHLRDWAVREAFIELRRREKGGLPLIDPNIIDPAKIDLPSNEELGDTEIII